MIFGFVMKLALNILSYTNKSQIRGSIMSKVKLIMLGNINVKTLYNTLLCIIYILKRNQKELDEIYILHTEKSYEALREFEKDKKQYMERLEEKIKEVTINNVKIPENKNSNHSIFDDAKFTSKLDNIFKENETYEFFVDITNGSSYNKNLLSISAYILELKNMYALDFAKFQEEYDKYINSDSNTDRKLIDIKNLESKIKQNSEKHISVEENDFKKIYDKQIYEFFEKIYLKVENSISLDKLSYLNVTNVIRFKNRINYLKDKYEKIDKAYFESSLIQSLKNKFYIDALEYKEGSDEEQLVLAQYRISSNTILMNIEELLEEIINKAGIDIKKDKATLGHKINCIKKVMIDKTVFNIDKDQIDFFEKTSSLILLLRNAGVHKTSSLKLRYERIRANLVLEASFSFLEFCTEILLNKETKKSKEIDVREILCSEIKPNEDYIYGIDGDDTGKELERLLKNKNINKLEKFSKKVKEARKKIVKFLEDEKKKNGGKIIFEAGDDILFKGKLSMKDLKTIQEKYSEDFNDDTMYGRTCSIGYGKTTEDAYLAMKLAKSGEDKNAIEGIAIKN